MTSTDMFIPYMLHLITLPKVCRIKYHVIKTKIFLKHSIKTLTLLTPFMLFIRQENKMTRYILIKKKKSIFFMHKKAFYNKIHVKMYGNKIY